MCFLFQICVVWSLYEVYAQSCSTIRVCYDDGEGWWDLWKTTYNGLRAKLDNPLLFGTTWALSPATFSYVPLNTITTWDLLSSCDMFFWWFQRLSTTSNTNDNILQSEIDALFDWTSNQWWKLLYACDNATYDVVCEAFGISTTSTTGNPDVVPTSITNNFLTCGNFATAQVWWAYGYFATPWALYVLGTYSGWPVPWEAVVIADDAYTPNYIFYADVNMFDNQTVSSTHSIDNGNDQFVVNSFVNIANSLWCMPTSSFFTSCTDVQYCGDGTTDPGEECDDGNSISGDWCSGSDVWNFACQVEYCWDDAPIVNKDPTFLVTNLSWATVQWTTAYPDTQVAVCYQENNGNKHIYYTQTDALGGFDFTTPDWWSHFNTWINIWIMLHDSNNQDIDHHSIMVWK